MNTYDNPRDYKTGDVIKDRATGEVGIIQRMVSATWVGANLYLWVYLIKKGYIKRLHVDSIKLVQKATETTKAYVDQTIHAQKPTATRPSSEVSVGKTGKVKTTKTVADIIDNSTVTGATKNPPNTVWASDKLLVKGREYKITVHSIPNYSPDMAIKFGKPTDSSVTYVVSIRYSSNQIYQTMGRYSDINQAKAVAENVKTNIHNVLAVSSISARQNTVRSISSKVRQEIGRVNPGLRKNVIDTVLEEVHLNSDFLGKPEDLNIQGVLQSSLRRQASEIKKLRRAQQILRSLYSGQTFSDVIREQLDDVMNDAVDRGHLKLVSGLRESLDLTAKIAAQRIDKVTGLNPQRVGVRWRAQELVEALERDASSTELNIHRTTTLLGELQIHSEMNKLGKLSPLTKFRKIHPTGYSALTRKDRLTGNRLMSDLYSEGWFSWSGILSDELGYEDFVGEGMNERNAKFGPFGDMTREAYDAWSQDRKVDFRFGIVNTDRERVLEVLANWKKTNPNKAITENDVLRAVWGNTEEASRRKLYQIRMSHGAQANNSIIRKSRMLMKRKEFEILRQNPDQVIDQLFIHKPTNLAVRVAAIDIASENINTTIHPLITDISGGRIRVNLQNGETAEQALSRLINTAQIMDTESILESSVEVAENMFTRPALQVGLDTYSVENILKEFGVVSKGANSVYKEGYTDLKYSKIVSTVLTKLGVTALDDHDMDDAVSLIHMKALQALRNRNLVFNAEDLISKRGGSDLLDQLSSVVIQSMGGKRGFSEAIYGRRGPNGEILRPLEDAVNELVDFDLLETNRQIMIDQSSAAQMAAGTFDYRAEAHKRLLRGIPTGSKAVIEDNNLFFKIKNPSDIANYQQLFGAYNFEEAAYGTGPAGPVIYLPDQTRAILGKLNIRNHGDVSRRAGKIFYGPRGTRGLPESVIGGYDDPNIAYTAINPETGIGTVIDSDVKMNMPFGSFKESSTAITEDELKNPFSEYPLIDLPVFSTNKGTKIGTSLDPIRQVSMIKDVIKNNEEMLFIDIETHGRGFGYQKLVQVGATKGQLGSTPQKLLDITYEGWAAIRENEDGEITNEYLKTLKSRPDDGIGRILPGSIDDPTSLMSAEIEMATSMADVVHANPESKIAIYNERVDLAKTGMVATKHKGAIDGEINRLNAAIADDRVQIRYIKDKIKQLKTNNVDVQQIVQEIKSLQAQYDNVTIHPHENQSIFNEMSKRYPIEKLNESIKKARSAIAKKELEEQKASLIALRTEYMSRRKSQLVADKKFVIQEYIGRLRKEIKTNSISSPDQEIEVLNSMIKDIVEKNREAIDKISSLRKVRDRLAFASKTLLRADAERAVNFMFLESAIADYSDIPGLRASLLKVGINEGQTHTAVEDTIQLAQLGGARKAAYASIDDDFIVNRIQSGDIFGKVFRPRRWRSQDAFGTTIENKTISNRYLEVIGLQRSINEATGAENYALKAREMYSNRIHILRADSPAFLASQLQDWDEVIAGSPAELEIDVRSGQVRTAQDLFRRRIRSIMMGESNGEGTSPFAFQSIDWQFKYGLMSGEELNRAKAILSSDIEKLKATSGDFSHLQKQYNWITNYLEGDPRMHLQFQVGAGGMPEDYERALKDTNVFRFNWYEDQYLKYDKPFFDSLRTKYEGGELSHIDVEHMARERFHRLYGESGLFPMTPGDITRPPNEWSFTPKVKGMDNGYSIRLNNERKTISDVESWVFEVFRRNIDEQDDATKVQAIRGLMGNSVSKGQIENFIEDGHFAEGSYGKELKRLLVEKALRSDTAIGEDVGVRSVLMRTAGITELSTEGDMLKNIGSAFYNSIINNPEAHKNNPALFAEVEGIEYLQGIEGRYPAQDFREAMRPIEEDILGKWDSIATQKRLFNDPSSEGKKFRKRVLAFTSGRIPSSFTDYNESLYGYTPDRVINEYGVHGYNKLGRMFQRNLEEKERGKPFLNMFQEEEIEKILGINNAYKDLETVSAGKLGNTFDWIVPMRGRLETLGTLVRNRSQEHVLDLMSSNNTLSNFHFEAVRRYYENSTKETLGPVPLSPGAQAVKDINEQTKNAPPKGLSVARTMLFEANMRQQAGVKAEQLGNWIARNVPNSLDDLSSKLQGMMSSPVSKGIAIAAGALLLAGSTGAGLKNKNQEPPHSEGEINDTPILNTRINEERPVNYRIKAKIRGSVSSEVDPGEIANTVHAAVDSHTKQSTIKTHNVLDDRETIDRRTAHKKISKLLK